MMIDFETESLSFCGCSGSELKRRFALRDFDETRILQRKFFADFNFAADLTDGENISRLVVGDKDLGFKTVADIAAFVVVSSRRKDYSAGADADELELKAERLSDLNDSLSGYKNRIWRHGERLTRYMNAAANFVVANENSAEAEKIRKRYNIATALRNFYVYVGSCVKNLSESVADLFNQLDRVVKHSYRSVFAGRLKSARREKKLPQKTLAKKLGLSQNGYAYYEKGEREPTVALIARCVKIFGCTADWLLGLEN